MLFFFLFKKKILFIYSREKGSKGEREGAKHQCVRDTSITRPHQGTWPATQACALTRNRTGDLLVHRLAGTQSTEPHQPGLMVFLIIQVGILNKKIFLSKTHTYISLSLNISLKTLRKKRIVTACYHTNNIQ